MIRALLALASLIVIAAVIGAAAWLWTSAGTPELAVPDELGLPRAIAEENLRKMGLTVEVIEEPGPDTMTGRVARMSPSPGSLVKPGRSIILYVISGAGAIVVPDLVGTYLIEAENRLARAGVESGVLGGLRMGEREEVASDSAAGTILAQSPPAGTVVKPGATVSLVVAVPKDGLRMPNLVGRTVAQATDTLAAAGYSAVQEPYFTTSRPPGTILSQEPAPGTVLKPELTIRLVVATPPQSSTAPPEEATTPGAAGLDAMTAPGTQEDAISLPSTSYPDAEAPPDLQKPPPTRPPAPRRATP